MSALALTACSRETDVPPPKASVDASAQRASDAQKVLTGFAKAVNAGDGDAAGATAVTSSQPLLRAVAANGARLRVSELAFRYVAEEDGRLTSDEQAEYGAKAFVATVDVSYRLAVDPGLTQMEMSFVFAPSAAGAHIAAIGGHDERSPLWMLGQLKITSSPNTLVLGGEGRDSSSYDGLAKQAILDVRKVLPQWRGNLVVEVPATEEQLDSILNADSAEYANIAAVTTTVDGSLTPTSPVHVFINPRVFGALGKRGAQVVLSHESTHVATKATFAQMPSWLLEGFADYVALAHADIPVTTAAGQILAQVRKSGAPKTLPTTEELSPTAPGLGATYEAAWTVCRFFAQQYGEASLVAFYRAVDGGLATAKAFEEIAHTTEAKFTDAWRADLTRLAR